jgi:hypothetical protein
MSRPVRSHKPIKRKRTNMNKTEELNRDEQRINHDIERIKHDEERLVRDVERLEHDKMAKYFYSLDGTKYESDVESITGAVVRAKLPPEKTGYPIFLEEHGGKPDKQITDAETFSLKKHPLCFYSAPPANFGLV